MCKFTYYKLNKKHPVNLKLKEIKGLKLKLKLNNTLDKHFLMTTSKER